MAMNSSGPISLGGATAGQSINLENGAAATAQVSLNDTAVRNLAGVASGAITMPTNFYGKSNVVNISYTFSANTANASLNLSSISGYSAGKSNITVTVNSGIYLYSTSVAGYGLSITGGTTGDTLTIVNNGYIMGQGGNGYPLSNRDGGPALNLGFGMTSCTINNTNASAYIGGGGGGGGANVGKQIMGGAGGVGGGSGGSGGTSGGGGGSIGGSGADGGYNCGGGGGRVFPGVGGAGNTTNGVGATGGGGGCNAGGAGGSSNNAGEAGTTYWQYGGGGGGGWGASGGGGRSVGGGSGGKAVNLNGKSVTWTSGNTTRVWGTVS